MMTEQQTGFSTAVLFVFFNRPEQSRRVFEEIRKTQPPRLYLASDGPRLDRDEAGVVAGLRERILEMIDWDCSVFYKFEEKNLGCKNAVSSAISWFFSHEEDGIILEDDCVPNQDFFFFCQEMLRRYQDDMRVWHVGGTNFQDRNWRGDGSYYFSRYNHVWGWATWRRAWKNYDVKISDFPKFADQRMIQNICPLTSEQGLWMSHFSQVYDGRIDTWDYQWTFTIWRNSGISVIPNRNLVSNIGFGDQATHTKGKSKFSEMQVDVLGQILHPTFFVVNREADAYTQHRNFKSPSFLKKVLNKLFADSIWDGQNRSRKKRGGS